MTTLEITRLCAEAMGYSPRDDMSVGKDFIMVSGEFTGMWHPLDNDAQAMALVKKFRLGIIQPNGEYPGWTVNKLGPDGSEHVWATNADLNRAICLAVAKMQNAKALA